MTIEIARLVAAGILVFTIIYQLQRVIRLLNEKEREVDALRDMVSYLTLTQRNCEDKSTDSGPAQEAVPLLAANMAPSGARERRLFPRHQTSKVGRIILHRDRPDDLCTVSNISPTGALLLVPNAHGLPDQFDLDMNGYSRRCYARWRGLDRIGVKLESMPAFGLD